MHNPAHARRTLAESYRINLCAHPWRSQARARRFRADHNRPRPRWEP